MYKVPTEIPKYCNKCPFGHCNYSKPFWATENCISKIDNERNLPNSIGYVCNLDFAENGKYTKVHRGSCSNDIPRPKDCKLEGEE